MALREAKQLRVNSLESWFALRVGLYSDAGGANLIVSPPGSFNAGSCYLFHLMILVQLAV